MMTKKTQGVFQGSLDEIRAAGQQKNERVLSSPQGSAIRTKEGLAVLNFCSNNYLGLANHPRVVEAAVKATKTWGFGLSSVRFICGTQEIHKDLERKVSSFLGTEDAILYSSCFDANAGLFETLLGPEDAIVSDELNHASIIDGIRLCKARKYRYLHADMADLEARLRESADSRLRLIATDGVFSMDGDTAKLGAICGLAEKYDALVMVDDSHATGFIGRTGRGTMELHEVAGRVDIVTTTFGKALGGASGGCTAGRAEIIALLRQRSRPYLFSNTLAPGIAGAVLEVFKLLEESPDLPRRVMENAAYFKSRMKALGFDLPPTDTAIVPVMLYEERLASAMAEKLLAEGIYVVGFSFPVVPKGKARIRTQVSAAHTKQDLDRAAEAFAKVGRDLGILKK